MLMLGREQPTPDPNVTQQGHQMALTTPTASAETMSPPATFPTTTPLSCTTLSPQGNSSPLIRILNSYYICSFGIDSSQPIMIPTDNSVTEVGNDLLSDLDAQKVQCLYHCDGCGGHLFGKNCLKGDLCCLS